MSRKMKVRPKESTGTERNFKVAEHYSNGQNSSILTTAFSSVISDYW